MMNAELVDCPPLPCRGSLKSVNWAPQFSPSEKQQTITRRSSRLSCQASSSCEPGPDCKVLINEPDSPREKIVSTEDQRDEEAPNGILSNTSTHGKTQHEAPANQAQIGAQMSLSQERICSNLDSRSRDQKVGGEEGNEDRKDGDPGMEKEASKDWVAVPLDDMETRVETVGNTRTKYRRKCQKVNQYRGQSHRNNPVKGETGRKVGIRNIRAVRQKLFSKNDRAEIDDKTLEELREMVTGLEGGIYDVAHIVHTLKEKKVQRTQAEKTQFEATARAEQRKLRDEISKLKRKNQVIQTEKLRIKRDRDRLKKDYLGVLDSTKEAQRLHAETVVAALNDELAREREKSFCQICFNTHRDAIVLPCMHFQYCNECLQTHQRRNTECPTCRGKINGVLRCKLGTT